MRVHATTLTVTSALIASVLVAGPSLAAPEPRGVEPSGTPTSVPVVEPRRRLPAPTAPSVPDALSRSLSRGRISAAVYALERARSLFDLAGVRARFGHVTRPDPRSATLVLRDLALRIGQLSGRARTIADRILARPTDGGGDPFDDGYTVSEEPPECSADVCVHYVATTADAPDPDDLDSSGVPDYVESVASVLDHVWAEEVDGLGYRAPKSDATSDNNGGSALLDVYLADIGVGGLYGYCASDDPHLGPPPYDYWDMSAYCVLDDDYDISQFGYPNPMRPLKVTAAHEFFHAVQFAYDIGEDGWLMESTATWMEEHVYDAINDNRQYLASSPLAQPSIPLDRTSGFRVYGTWIFWQFLTEYLGGSTPDANIVRAVWRRADGSAAGPDMYSTQALAAAVGARTIDGTRWRFRWAFADFGVWNARPAKFYDEGGAYPSAPVSRSATLTRAAPSMSSTAKLDHLTNRFVVARRGSGLRADARLRVTVNGPPTGTGPEASVVVIRKSGAASSKVVALNTAGNGTVTVAFDSTVARVVVIMTNASTRYRDCYEDLTPFACFGGLPLDQNRTYAFRTEVV
jgi:hypothetical protein